MGFSRKEYWSGLSFPSPRDLPNPGIKPRFPALQADALTSEPPGKLQIMGLQRVGHDWATELTDWLTDWTVKNTYIRQPNRMFVKIISSVQSVFLPWELHEQFRKAAVYHTGYIIPGQDRISRMTVTRGEIGRANGEIHGKSPVKVVSKVQDIPREKH